LELAKSQVRVYGRVLRGSEPVADLSIVFVRETEVVTTRTTTDAAGSYELFLDSPGEYTVMMRGGALHDMRRISIVDGDNAQDFVFRAGAAIVARVQGQTNGDESLTVEIRREQSSSFVSSQVLRGTSEASWSDLAYGGYVVSARQGELASEVKRVVLEKSAPSAVVELELLPQRSTITVRDEGGRPIGSVRFYFMFPSPHETSPGVYSLEGVAPGTPVRMRVSPTMSPVCRIALRDTSIEVTASTGRPVTLEVQGGKHDVGVPDASIVGMAGSDCPVSLEDFEWTRVPTESNSVARFVIRNFPTSEQVTLINANGRQILNVSESGTVTLDLH
jgi:hypothetical protein